MNTFADYLSNTQQEQNETVRQELKPAADAALLELGKVSDTQGGWVGQKFDVGLGFTPY